MSRWTETINITDTVLDDIAVSREVYNKQLEKNNNLKLECKNLLNEIDKMIKDISSLGFDTNGYEKRLKLINSKFEFNNGDDDYINYDAFLRIKGKEYTDIVNNLNELKSHLEGLNVYFRAVNFNSLVDSRVNTVNRTKIDVSDLVVQMIDILVEIQQVNICFDGEKEIKEKIFDSVYRLIKLEISTNFDSELYNYVISDSEFLHFINECIRKEINGLDLSDSKYCKLKEKIATINNNGLNNNYYDLEVIKLLLNTDNNFMLGDKICNKLTSNINNIKSVSNSITKKFSYDISRLKDRKNNLVEYRKEFIKRFTALALTVSITTGGGIGIFKWVKGWFTNDYCNKIVTTYSSRNGLNSLTEEIPLSYKDSFDNKIYLKEYGLWGMELNADGKVRREIKQYDISDVKLSNIEDYLNYAIDDSTMYYTLSYEYGDPNSVLRYDSEYLEVEKTNVDTSDVKTSTEPVFSAILFLMYVLYVVLLIFINFIPCFGDYNFYSHSCIVEYSVNCFKYLKDIFDTRKCTINDLNSISGEINKMLSIINENEQLKLEFDKLYKENVYLLDNPEELYKEFEKVSLDFDKNSNNLLDSVRDIKVKKLELTTTCENNNN